jgi:hypothetical protein
MDMYSQQARIPLLLHHFDDESREKIYLVMEFITLATIKEALT